MLSCCQHNGFPVVRVTDAGDCTLCGMLLRRQLEALLTGILRVHLLNNKQPTGSTHGSQAGNAAGSESRPDRTRRFSVPCVKISAEGQPAMTDEIKETFIVSALKARKTFDASEILDNLNESERNMELDLTPFMDASPNMARKHMPLKRAYRLFNELGVRHLPVVGLRNELIGILVRKGTPARQKPTAD